jgi:hypothetical protein
LAEDWGVDFIYSTARQPAFAMVNSADLLGTPGAVGPDATPTYHERRLIGADGFL